LDTEGEDEENIQNKHAFFGGKSLARNEFGSVVFFHPISTTRDEPPERLIVPGGSKTVLVITE
jgi:hypothetical protein